MTHLQARFRNLLTVCRINTLEQHMPTCVLRMQLRWARRRPRLQRAVKTLCKQQLLYLRMRERLKHEHASALAHDETVAPGVPRPRRLLRLVAARRQRPAPQSRTVNSRGVHAVADVLQRGMLS